MRAACRRALAAVVAAADLLLVVGDGPVWGMPEPSATGSFRPYGADLAVSLPAPASLADTPSRPAGQGGAPSPRADLAGTPSPAVELELPGLPVPARLPGLPLSLAVAAYLLAGLDRPPGRLAAVTVPASLGPGAAVAVGRALTGEAADRGGRVGLVVMGDLSACRTERAPGALRAEAAGFDASVAEALRTGKPARLLDLDPALAADLLVAGRVPLQVLAGAFEDGPPMRGEILYDAAPYGVGYLVGLLTPS